MKRLACCAAAAVLLLVGCQSGEATPADTPTSPPTTTPETTMPETTAPSGDPEPVQTDARTDAAVEDLASRVGAEASAITIVRRADIDWRDGSLGCPEKDKMYTQAIVPGEFLLLEHDGTRYQYHAARGQGFFFCANPSEPEDPMATVEPADR